jgi:RNA polymerase-binding protein DksA
MALTPEQSRELEQTVNQRRAVLAAEVGRDLDRLREDGVDNVVGAVPDPGDESVASMISDLDQADASRDMLELQSLDAARERMAEGTYGICVQCGQDIGFERLRANPAAQRCIRCQTLYEKTHASPGVPRL